MRQRPGAADFHFPTGSAGPAPPPALRAELDDELLCRVLLQVQVGDARCCQGAGEVETQAVAAAVLAAVAADLETASVGRAVRKRATGTGQPCANGIVDMSSLESLTTGST